MIQLISNALGAVKEYFGWQKQNVALKNTPEMQANAKAGQDAVAQDKARKLVAEGDEDAIRRSLS
jgi:hypothetical protein